MTNNENPLHHQPYEVIETEETITRHFNPSHSKDPTFSTNNNHKMYYQPEPHPYEQHDPKIVLNNYHFQDLYEKFNKLRMVMSELTEKFKEINLAKSKLPSFDDDAETRKVTDPSFRSSFKPKLQESNLNNFSKDCNSRVSVESQTDKMQAQPASSKEFIADETRCRDSDSVRSYQKRSEAPLLRKSKKILISLIDKELQKIQSSQKVFHPEKSMVNVPVSYATSKNLKMECIDRITEELTVLKDLEGFNGS